MTFKQEILAALHSGQDHGALLEIVRRHHAQGLSGKAPYELLQQVWQEFGFHETGEASSLRDELEYVLERVWYFGPGAG